MRAALDGVTIQERYLASVRVESSGSIERMRSSEWFLRAGVLGALVASNLIGCGGVTRTDGSRRMDGGLGPDAGGSRAKGTRSGSGGALAAAGGRSSSEGGAASGGDPPSSGASDAGIGTVAAGGRGIPVASGGSGGTPIRRGSGGKGPMGTGGFTVDLAPYLSPDGTYFIKDPPGNLPIGPDAPNADYCFNVVAHNDQTPLASDPSPFKVKASEFIHEFQFKVPYDKPVWALSTRPIIDNVKVVGEWLLFQMGRGGTDGSHADGIGLELNNAMLTGWAPGGNPLDMPADVGLEMPDPGGFVLLEHLYYNATGTPALDRSGVRVCVTYSKPAHPASLVWLGTENISSIPANQTGSATGICTTWKKDGDVHVLQAVPHMHKLGTRLRTVINRAGGGTDVVVDKPFVFTEQRAYAMDAIVHANDTLSTTCTWQNTTSASVGFGVSLTQEVCYDYVVYYPAHALEGVGGIEGSTNMCLQ